jgi:hypothetical protein
MLMGCSMIFVMVASQSFPQRYRKRRFSHHEIVAVAVGESGRNHHFVRSASPDAVAVSQIRLTEGRERSVLGGVVHARHSSQLRPSRYKVPA